nr:MAG TPA: hypothetical protein [Caudoviricetes sp.]
MVLPFKISHRVYVRSHDKTSLLQSVCQNEFLTHRLQ